MKRGRERAKKMHPAQVWAERQRAKEEARREA